MSEPVIRIVYDGDELYQFYVDETNVGNANHDDHGWDGMEGMCDLAKNIGEALGIKVVEE